MNTLGYTGRMPFLCYYFIFTILCWVVVKANNLDIGTIEVNELLVECMKVKENSDVYGEINLIYLTEKLCMKLEQIYMRETVYRNRNLQMDFSFDSLLAKMSSLETISSQIQSRITEIPSIVEEKISDLGQSIQERVTEVRDVMQDEVEGVVSKGGELVFGVAKIFAIGLGVSVLSCCCISICFPLFMKKCCQKKKVSPIGIGSKFSGV